MAESCVVVLSLPDIEALGLISVLCETLTVPPIESGTVDAQKLKLTSLYIGTPDTFN